MASVIDLTMAEYKARLDAFAGGMQTNFDLPAVGSEPLHADGPTLMVEEADATRTEQIVAQLQMLGYLPEKLEFDRKEIDVGLEHWNHDFREALESGALILSPELQAEKLENIPWPEARIRYLKAVATFEGEVALARLPGIGELTLASRIVQLRLIAYGLARVFDSTRTDDKARFSAGERYASASAVAAAIGAPLFLGAGAGELELINLLGSAPAATDAFLTRHAGLRFLFQGPPSQRTDSILRWQLDREPVWRPRWKAIGPFWRPASAADNEPLPRLTDSDTNPPMDLAMLNAQARLPINVVALGLLQLRLWTLGYYLGALDGSWGFMTEEALERFGSDHRNLLGAPIDYVAAGFGGWRAVNLLRILGTVVDRFDLPSEQLSTQDLHEIAVNAVESLDEPAWRDVEGKYQVYRAREHGKIGRPVLEFERLSLRTTNPARRRYFGWRRFFAAAAVFVHGIAGRILGAARAIVRALREGIGQAFEVLRFLWRKVRVAVRIARLAARRLYCWLTSSPIGTVVDTHCTITWWSLDFDTVVISSHGCPQAVLDRHYERLDWMSRSLNFMGQLALFAISALASLATAGWLALAYRVYTFFREMIANPEYQGVFSEDILERGTV